MLIRGGTMNRKYQMIAFAVIFISAASAFSPARAQQQEKKSDILMISVGMPKENIYAVYPAQYQLKDYMKDGMEVIVFNDYLTSHKGDIITFYLKNGKVHWWDKVHGPKTNISSEDQKVYKGMTKEKLYEAYPAIYQIQHYEKGDMEVIMFDDYLTKDIGDTVTFYLKNGKVDWWDKVQVNATPEDRLAAVMNRTTHAQQGLSQDDSSLIRTVGGIKEGRHLDNMGAGIGTLKRYLKER